MPRACRRRRSIVRLLGALGIASALLAAPVAAAPLDDMRAEAAALEAEIAANAEQLSHIYEQIKAAQAQYDEATATIADARARITLAKQEADRLRDLVRRRAASVYRSSSNGASDAGIFELDVSTLSSREQYASAASERDDDLIERLAAAKADLAIVRRESEEAKAAAEREQARLAAITADFEAKQAEREQLLAGVEGEIAALVAEAAAAKKAQADAEFDPGTVPPASGKGGVAVAYAQAQLGKPYCYAGVGPDCFDCSGLTMKAWGAAGVGMSHNSEAQYAAFPHVPMNQLAPGDILWTPGHVGLFVSGGTAIHAPNTGDVVRYHSASYYQGAARPG